MRADLIVIMPQKTFLKSDLLCVCVCQPPELRWATVGLVSLLGSANAFVILPYFCWLKRGVFPCFAGPDTLSRPSLTVRPNNVLTSFFHTCYAACFFCCRRSDNGSVHDSYQALPVFE